MQAQDKQEDKQKTLVMTFEESLADKDALCGELITITEIEPEQEGDFGPYRVAKVEYNGKKLRISLGSVLSKNFAEWEATAKTKAIPCKAIIQKRKNYFAFSRIEAMA